MKGSLVKRRKSLEPKEKSLVIEANSLVNSPHTPNKKTPECSSGARAKFTFQLYQQAK